ncbi:MAG: polysaccharide biosynthesis protein [Magnetococcales bacterium]|nr:polysaccharide biosynthesis protein [Magnetococcales bacterium]
MQAYQGKSVLVTGACGTVGQALSAALLTAGVGHLSAFDNNEAEIFFFGERYRHDPRVRAEVGDVREVKRLHQAMKGIDFVFHGAALKNVVVCERSPFEAVQTNILGVENVIAAALAHGVERVLFMSSDKAVNPTNVMGTSKLMGERLMTAALHMRLRERTIFTSSRFGNVLGSRGSVLPIFAGQIRRGEPLTLTDPRMTRFVMSSAQAVQLVMRGAVAAKGGEVFVTKMPVVRIEELARAMIRRLAPRFGRHPDAIPVQCIGGKPGEKLYEELLSEEEVQRTLELPDHFVVIPAFRNLYDVEYRYPGQSDQPVTNPYRSDREPALSLAEVERFLEEHGLIEESLGNT